MPSNCQVFLGSTPVAAARVGNNPSRQSLSGPMYCPRQSLPGQRNSDTSHECRLHRSPLYPPRRRVITTWVNTRDLRRSERNKTMVLSSIPSSSNAVNTLPMAWSMASTTAAYSGTRVLNLPQWPIEIFCQNYFWRQGVCLPGPYILFQILRRGERLMRARKGI